MKRVLKALLRLVIVLFVLLNIVVAFHAYKFTHFYNNGEISVKNAAEKTDYWPGFN